MILAHSSNSGRPRILICGYYGEHNLGDDALLSVLLNQLDDRWEPVITARDREAVESLAPGIETVDRRSLATVLKDFCHWIEPYLPIFKIYLLRYIYFYLFHT